MKPNVILITTDQMRGDCIGRLGHPDVKTPFLDTMINHGVAFQNAYSATPTCVPARVALLTGLSQKTHGRVGYQDGVEWDYDTTIASAFAQNGYHTQCVGKMHVHPPRKLMGFHNVVLHDGFLPYRNTNTAANGWWDRIDDYTTYLREQVGHDADIMDTGIDCNSWVAKTWPYPEHTHCTNWTVTGSIDFLRRRDPTKPFFLYTSFLAPHPPFTPPASYLERYINKDLAKPYMGDWAEQENGATPDMDCFGGQLKDDEIHELRAAYYAMITQVDHQIGRLMRALKDEGVLNNTIILFTSDHGEMLGDHNLYRKNQAFNGSAKIPMIVYDPGKLLGLTQGVVSDTVAELRDVFPTLMDAAGIACPECVEGKSLIESARAGVEIRDYLHGEHTAQQLPTQSAQYIVTKEYKYIWHSDTGREFFFDLIKDPNELQNLAQEVAYQEQLAAMRGHLIAELDGREEGYSDGKQLLAGKIPVTILSSKHSC